MLIRITLVGNLSSVFCFVEWHRSTHGTRFVTDLVVVSDLIMWPTSQNSVRLMYSVKGKSSSIIVHLTTPYQLLMPETVPVARKAVPFFPDSVRKLTFGWNREPIQREIVIRFERNTSMLSLSSRIGYLCVRMRVCLRACVCVCVLAFTLLGLGDRFLQPIRCK